MFDSLKALNLTCVLNSIENDRFNISVGNADNIAFTSDFDYAQIAFNAEYVLSGNSAFTRLMCDLNSSDNPHDLIGVVYTDTVTISDYNALDCSVYVKSHESALFVSVVLTDNGQAVYSRTVDVLRDEMTDGEENDMLNNAQRYALDKVFMLAMLRNELAQHVTSRSVTNTHDDSYGVLLHSMNNICDYYSLTN